MNDLHLPIHCWHVTWGSLRAIVPKLDWRLPWPVLALLMVVG